MSRKLFPSPWLSAALAIMWLILNQSLSAGHLILAVVLGWALPVLFAPLRPQHVRLHKPLTVLRYSLAVGKDVIVWNLIVARDVLLLSRRRPNSVFVTVPLDLRDPTGLAMLALVTTVVPGTVWCELARDASAVMIHVWDLDNEADFIEEYKRLYEAPLREIFE